MNRLCPHDKTKKSFLLALYDKSQIQTIREMDPAVLVVQYYSLSLANNTVMHQAFSS